MQQVTLQKINRADRKQIKTFEEMYRSYLKELSLYNKSLNEPKEFEDSLRYALRTDAYRDDYFIMLNKNIVGFALIGSFPNSYSKNDIYIQEFYILPDKRRRGFGTSAVKEISKRYPEKEVSLFILDKNETAEMFWDYAMRFSDRDEMSTTRGMASAWDGLVWHYYGKEKKRGREFGET